MAGLGNLYLVLTLPEIRRKGLNYLSLYALQRAVQVSSEYPRNSYSQAWRRRETGLKDYETSRAFQFLSRQSVLIATDGGSGF